jgi:acetyl-CoA C-acetyltransferase
MKKAYIIGGKRTPIGSLLGSLQAFTGPQLSSVTIRSLLEQTKLNPKSIDHVILGNVLSTGLGQNPARQASLGGGVDVSVPCTNINKVCASGMKATTIAASELMLGDSNIIISGGFESMTNAPHFIKSLRTGVKFGDTPIYDTVSYDGLIDAYGKMAMGFCGEKTAKELGITREIQDEYAISSYERTLEAIKSKKFDSEISGVDIPKKGMILADDEPQRFNKDKFSTFRPAFADKSGSGTITAGNASKINDGACSLLLMNEVGLKTSGLTPIAEIISFADAENLPIDFNLTPPLAIKKALAKANLTVNDIDFWEINEAFSITAIANMKLLGIDHQRLNVHGGAVALGHPIGMSGARIILSLTNVLQTYKGTYGCAAICNGGGGATAIILKRV